jgi:purine-binding chemotaxis protein CheW
MDPSFENSAAPAAPRKVTGKYLEVLMDNNAYGIGLSNVREIIHLQKITPVPLLPDYCKGVINLRGRVITIVDLRVRLGLKAVLSERTCIVVVQFKTAASRVLHMGMIVDSVEEVLPIASDDIEPAPESGTKISTQYLLGMAKVKGQVMTLIDIGRIVSSEAQESPLLPGPREAREPEPSPGHDPMTLPAARV